MKKKIKIIGIIALVAFLVLALVNRRLPSSVYKDDTKTLYGPYYVERIVDGDTILVDIDGKQTRVRLIGLDCPESVNPDETLNTEEGKLASKYTKELIEKKYVYLEYDEEKVDEYGRTLSYVYLDDRLTMVNELILKNGYATTMRIRPNTKYANNFSKLEKEAKKNKLGIWAK